MSAVSSARRKKVDPLTKRIPENPKYKHVKSGIDTGASLTKYLDRIDEMKQNYKLRKDEIFRRMKITTFIQLIVQVYLANEDDEFTLSEPPESDRVGSNSPDEEIMKVQADMTSPVPSLSLNDAGDVGDQSGRHTLHSVTQGVGELAFNKPDTPQEKAHKQECPYLLLDVRDIDEYQTGHITTALNYPKAILSRSVNYETKEMLSYKNIPGKIIVVYDDEERVAPGAASTLVQRGYDNLFMLSGGIKLVRKLIPEGLVTCKGDTESGKFTNDAINTLEFHCDQAMQDNSIGTSSRLSKSSTSSSRQSSRATVRSADSKFSGRTPFR